MKIHCIFLSGFLAVSSVFFSSYAEAEKGNRSAVTKQKPIAEVNKGDKTKAVKTSQKKVTKQKVVTEKPAKFNGKSNVATQKAFQKPLDLSIPYQDVENANLVTEQTSEGQSRETNIFASVNKKKTRALQVDGRMLTSQEPEVEKQKSAEGAGIVINLKP